MEIGLTRLASRNVMTGLVKVLISIETMDISGSQKQTSVPKIMVERSHSLSQSQKP